MAGRNGMPRESERRQCVSLSSVGYARFGGQTALPDIGKGEDAMFTNKRLIGSAIACVGVLAASSFYSSQAWADDAHSDRETCRLSHCRH